MAGCDYIDCENCFSKAIYVGSSSMEYYDGCIVLCADCIESLDECEFFKIEKEGFSKVKSDVDLGGE